MEAKKKNDSESEIMLKFDSAQEVWLVIWPVSLAGVFRNKLLYRLYFILKKRPVSAGHPRCKMDLSYWPQNL